MSKAAFQLLLTPNTLISQTKIYNSFAQTSLESKLSSSPTQRQHLMHLFLNYNYNLNCFKPLTISNVFQISAAKRMSVFFWKKSVNAYSPDLYALCFTACCFLLLQNRWLGFSCLWTPLLISPNWGFPIHKQAPGTSVCALYVALNTGKMILKLYFDIYSSIQPLSFTVEL